MCCHDHCPNCGAQTPAQHQESFGERLVRMNRPHARVRLTCSCPHEGWFSIYPPPPCPVHGQARTMEIC